MKKYLWIFLLFLAGIIRGEPPLVIGTTSGYAPYVSLNRLGEYEGFDIDFARALGEKLNRKVVIKDYGSMPSLLLALQQEKIDLLIWAISITMERESKMEMIYYQGDKVTEMPLLFWEKIPENITTLDDLVGRTISAEASSFQEGVLQKVAGIALKQIEKVPDGIMEIRYGKSQGVMVDPSIVPELQKKYPQLRVLQIPLPPGDCSKGNGLCINKKNTAFAEQVRNAVAELTKEGQVEALEKKWGMR